MSLSLFNPFSGLDSFCSSLIMYAAVFRISYDNNAGGAYPSGGKRREEKGNVPTWGQKKLETT